MKRLIVLSLALSACKADKSRLPIDTAAQVNSDSVLISPVDTTSGAVKDCGVSGTAMLTEKGIGELQQGRPVADIAARCEVLSDSQQRGTEGQMERVLVLRVAGETLRAVVTDDRIFRIEVNTPRFHTADSLGVDTPLRRIASMRGAQFAPGEDGVYGFSPEHCGLSFRFSLPWRPPAGGQWTAQAIAERHGDAAVNRVIVIECRR